ncbi:MAG: hypothetical protein AAF211_00395 [Myxococcota bacterium]
MQFSSSDVFTGQVRGFMVGPRAMYIKLLTNQNRRLVIEVDLSRPDFDVQLEIVKYVMAANDEHAVRSANGFQMPADKQLWVLVAPGTGSPTSGGPQPRRLKARALGLGTGSNNPFNHTPQGF